MSAELNYVQEPLSVLCGHECPVGETFWVTVVCKIAVFFSSEELAGADGECHVSCNTLPSHQNMNSFYFPSNHSTFPVFTAAFCAHSTRAHLCTRTCTCTRTAKHTASPVFRSGSDCCPTVFWSNPGNQ